MIESSLDQGRLTQKLLIHMDDQDVQDKNHIIHPVLAQLPIPIPIGIGIHHRFIRQSQFFKNSLFISLRSSAPSASLR